MFSKTFLSEAQSKRRRECAENTHIETLEGTEYYPQKQGSIILLWKSPEQQQIKFKIYLSELKHEYYDKSLRVRVNFVATDICVSIKEGVQALYNFNKINCLLNGNGLLHLWATERYKITETIPLEAANITSPARPSGIPMLKAFKMILEE